jgi:hypothetical protein
MPRSSDDRILFHLKARGPQTAFDVGARFGMTPTGWSRVNSDGNGADGRRSTGNSRFEGMGAFPTDTPT